MPVPKDVMRDMVRYIESTMPVYPTRFHDIAAVKAYIINTSAADAIESGHLTYEVLDSVTYQVAFRAYQSGEFYLDAPPPDRRALRTAIESAMALILPQIGSWPQGFTYVAEVKTFISVVCAPIVDGLMFPTLRPEKFKDYVLFHTARQAWEERKYEMKVVPEMWCRAAIPLSRMKEQVPKSLSDAISINITHLHPLLHSWPAYFLDLNAARNYVGGVCADNRFKYTYWPDVEERKFRCFVHFNAARHAWREGRFRLDREGERRRVAVHREVRREGLGVSTRAYGEGWREVSLRREEQEIEKEVEVGELGPIVVEAPATSSSSATIDAFDFLTTAQDDDEDVEMLEFGNEMESVAGDCDMSAPDAEAVRCDSAADVEDVEKVEEKVDPFKDLLHDLKRTALLKAAFE